MNNLITALMKHFLNDVSLIKQFPFYVSIKVPFNLMTNFVSNHILISDNNRFKIESSKLFLKLIKIIIYKIFNITW